MRKETTLNPDIERGFRSFEQRNSPEFTHFDSEWSEPLDDSDNPAIKNLLASGFKVCEVVSRFYMGMRSPTGYFDRHYVAKLTHEFEIALATDGFLRIRFSAPDRVLLSLFSIFPDRRGRGLARLHFPLIIDALFRSGVNFVFGEVASAYSEPRNSLDTNKLIRFYVREMGFKHEGGWEITKESPYKTKGVGRQVNLHRKAKKSSPSKLLTTPVLHSP